MEYQYTTTSEVDQNWQGHQLPVPTYLPAYHYRTWEYLTYLWVGDDTYMPHTHTHTHTQYASSRSYLKGWKAVVDRCIEIGYQIPRQHLVRPLLAIWSKKGHALVAPTSVARVRLLVSFISIPIPYIWINNMIYPREKLDNTHAVNYYRGGPSGSIILFTDHNDVKVVVVLNWKGDKKKAVRMW